MAVVAVDADNSRYDAMDTAANVFNIGGGGSAGAEVDIAYQNGISLSRKATAHGFGSDTGATRDFTAAGRVTWIVKAWLTDYGSLTTGANKVEVRFGDAAGTYYNYVFGSATVDYPAKGGWVILAIDPSIASHRTGTVGGGPSGLTALDYFAVYADSAGAKSPNLCLDAIDAGVGLYLSGGDGGSADGDFADFVADDEGDVANGRFGYVSTIEGVLFVLGSLIIGATSASGTLTTVATGFTDSDVALIFPDNLAAAGFSGLIIDLGNASTLVDFTSCQFGSKGTSTGEDTRAILEITGTSGAFTSDGCSYDNFASVIATTGCDFLNSKFNNCGLITAAGGTFTDATVSNSPAAAAMLWNTALDPNGELDGILFSSSGTGHALELGASCPSTITLTDHTYTGYAGTDGSTGNEVIYNNSAKAITINITGGSTPTIRNGTSASTTVVNAAPISITVTDDVGVVIQNARVEVSATETVGTITTGDVILTGLTSVLGIIEDTGFAYEGAFDPTGLDVKIKARQGSVSPYKVPGLATGTIKSTGLSLTIALLPDE